MADATQELAILIRTEVSKALRDFQRTQKALDDQGKSSEKTAKSVKSLDTAWGQITASLSAYLSVATAVQALKFADDWNTLQQRVKAATKETGDYVGVAKELYAISKQNGAALEDVVATFQRLALARKEIKATNGEILTVTNSVLQLGRLSGASTAAMQAGTLQFAQAMGAGVFRAEELNSVLENLPALADRIAKGMGLTVGKLRQAVLDGRVLSREVFNAILSQSEDIAREMESMPLNLQRSWTVATTALGKFLAKLDELTGVTDFISKSLQGLASILDRAAEPEFNLLNLQQRRLQIIDAIAVKEAYIANFRGPEFAKADLLRELEALREELGAIEQQLTTNSQKAIEFLNAKPSTDKTAGAPSGSGASLGKGKTDQNESAVRSLEIEAATFGMAADAALLYQLRLEGATEAQLRRAKAALDNIRAEQEFEEAVRASEDAVEAENAEYDRWLKSKEQAARAIKDVLDPLQPLRREMEELNVLLNLGKLSWDEWAEAMLRVQERMDEMLDKSDETGSKLDQFAVQAARNMQSAFADFLFDPFSEGLDGMLRGFIQAVHRMVSEALAAKLANKLFGDDFSKGGELGGVLGGFLKSATSFLFHEGGIVGAGGAARQLSPLLFDNAPRYHAGGIAGLAPNEVPSVLLRGEEVLPESSPRHINNAGSGQMGLNLTLVDDRASLGQFLSSSEGNKTLIEQIRRNSGTIRRVLSI